MDRASKGHSGGMENNSCEHIYHDALIFVIPSGKDPDGNLNSLLYHSDSIVEFLDICFQVTTKYSPELEFVVFDAATSKVDFSKEKQLRRFMAHLNEIDEKYFVPLYVVFAIDKPVYIRQATILAEGIKKMTNSTVALFNLDSQVMEKLEEEDYIDIRVGKSSHEYLLSKIVEKNLTGSLYGTYDILPDAEPYSL